MADRPSSRLRSETIAARLASLAGGLMPASMQASATTCIVGRTPLVRRAETTDLMEFLNLLISLGSFQKCEPARTWVVVVIKETRPVPTIRFSTRFSSLRKKNFSLNRLKHSRTGAGVLQYMGFSSTYSENQI
jgi:hypothetical protein